MKHTKHNQDGLASILIVSVIIVIIALTTMGFAKVSDRELRQSLDRELSLQANYAAESGMNDARAYVLSQIQSGHVPDTDNKCMDLSSPPAPFAKNGSVSGQYSGDNTDNLVKYSCVIIDSSPKQLVFDVPAGQSKVFKVSAAGLKNMYFGWQNKGATPNGATVAQPLGPESAAMQNTLPQENAVSANKTGILRTTIYGVPSSLGASLPSGTANQILYNASATYLMYPSGGTAGQVGTRSASGTSGDYIFGKCSTDNMNASPLPYKQDGGRYCNTGVTGVNGLGAGISFYYVRLTALYHDLSVAFQATDGSNSLGISNAQAVIDVTGEGNDVLKRLQGRVSLATDVDMPNYGLQSMDTLCKRLRLPKTSSTGYGNAVLDLGASGNPGSACQL